MPQSSNTQKHEMLYSAWKLVENQTSFRGREQVRVDISQEGRFDVKLVKQGFIIKLLAEFGESLQHFRLFRSTGKQIVNYCEAHTEINYIGVNNLNFKTSYTKRVHDFAVATLTKSSIKDICRQFTEANKIPDSPWHTGDKTCVFAKGFFATFENAVTICLQDATNRDRAACGALEELLTESSTEGMLSSVKESVYSWAEKNEQGIAGALNPSWAKAEKWYLADAKLGYAPAIKKLIEVCGTDPQKLSMEAKEFIADFLMVPNSDTSSYMTPHQAFKLYKILAKEGLPVPIEKVKNALQQMSCGSLNEKLEGAECYEQGLTYNDGSYVIEPDSMMALKFYSKCAQDGGFRWSRDRDKINVQLESLFLRALSSPNQGSLDTEFKASIYINLSAGFAGRNPEKQADYLIEAVKLGSRNAVEKLYALAERSHSSPKCAEMVFILGRYCEKNETDPEFNQQTIDSKAFGDWNYRMNSSLSPGKDISKAIEFYRQAVEFGNREALERIWNVYLENPGYKIPLSLQDIFKTEGLLKPEALELRYQNIGSLVTAYVEGVPMTLEDKWLLAEYFVEHEPAEAAFLFMQLSAEDTRENNKEVARGNVRVMYQELKANTGFTPELQPHADQGLASFLTGDFEGMADRPESDKILPFIVMNHLVVKFKRLQKTPDEIHELIDLIQLLFGSAPTRGSVNALVFSDQLNQLTSSETFKILSPGTVKWNLESVTKAKRIPAFKLLVAHPDLFRSPVDAAPEPIEEEINAREMNPEGLNFYFLEPRRLEALIEIPEVQLAGLRSFIRPLIETYNLVGQDAFEKVSRIPVSQREGFWAFVGNLVPQLVEENATEDIKVDLLFEAGIVPLAEREEVVRECTGQSMGEILTILTTRTQYSQELKETLNAWQRQASSLVNLAPILTLPSCDKKVILDWLDGLTKTSDYATSRSSVASIACKMLETVKSNEEFKQAFLAQIRENNEACGDRRSMGLNELYTLWMLHNLPREAPLSIRLGTLFGLAKTFLLRERIVQLINLEEQRMGTEVRESTEIFLYYEHHLKDQLKLCSFATSMLYGSVGRRDWIVEADLIQYVNDNAVEKVLSLPAFKALAENEASFQDLWAPEDEKSYAEIEQAEEDRVAEKFNEGEYMQRVNQLNTQRELLKIALMKQWLTQQSTV